MSNISYYHKIRKKGGYFQLWWASPSAPEWDKAHQDEREEGQCSLRRSDSERGSLVKAVRVCLVALFERWGATAGSWEDNQKGAELQKQIAWDSQPSSVVACFVWRITGPETAGWLKLSKWVVSENIPRIFLISPSTQQYFSAKFIKALSLDAGLESPSLPCSLVGMGAVSSYRLQLHWF